jgi:hypothetical protein
MERACEEANTQESAHGGARPLGRPGSERGQETRQQTKRPLGRLGQKLQEDYLTPGATLAGRHAPDAARKDERGGGLDPRPLRTTRDRSRLSRNPAVGALWLFWHHQQRLGTPQLPALCHRRHRHMAEMAKSPLPAGLDILGGNAPGLCTKSFASAGHPARCHQVAKP